MTNLNNDFMESYKHLDKICKEIFNSEKGVTTYIDTMKEVNDGNRYVPLWNKTLYKLKHYRHIRNNYVHEVGTSQYDICTRDDIEWLNNFYKEIISHRRELKFFRSSEYELVFKYKGYFYNVWIANKYYGYLSIVRKSKISRFRGFFKDLSSEVYYAPNKQTIFNDVRPSRETLINFYENVEKPAYYRLQLLGLLHESKIEREIDYIMLNGNQGKIIKKYTNITFLTK